MRLSSRFAIAATATLASLVVFAGAAAAISTYRIAGVTTKQYFATSDTPFAVPGPNTWQTVPSTGIVASTSAPTVIDARFTAESLCQGAGWCAVRIIYSSNGGAWTELAPQSGSDYAFDSDGDLWAGHSMERSSAFYVPAGTVSIVVQAMRVSATAFRLDDYHLAIGTVVQ